MYKRHVEFRFEIGGTLFVVEEEPSTSLVNVRVWPAGPTWVFRRLADCWTVEPLQRSFSYARMQDDIGSYLNEHGLPMGPW